MQHTDCRSPELHIHFREADSHSIGSRQPQPERQAGHEKRGAYLFLNIPRFGVQLTDGTLVSKAIRDTLWQRTDTLVSFKKGGSGGQPHGLPAATENQHPPPGTGTCRYLRL